MWATISSIYILADHHGIIKLKLIYTFNSFSQFVIHITQYIYIYIIPSISAWHLIYWYVRQMPVDISWVGQATSTAITFVYINLRQRPHRWKLHWEVIYFDRHLPSRTYLLYHFCTFVPEWYGYNWSGPSHDKTQRNDNYVYSETSNLYRVLFWWSCTWKCMNKSSWPISHGD